MKKRDDVQLIQAILCGHTEYYEELLNTYSQPVFSLIVRIVNNREDAEELTQDTFLKAFQHLSAFKGESSFSTWLYRIAYRTAVSALRRHTTDTLPLDDKLTAHVTDEQIDALLNDESDTLTDRLTEALKRLTADERTLLTLFYEEEKPIREIAYILGGTESNIKVKLHRIRKKLYILLKDAKEYD